MNRFQSPISPSIVSGRSRTKTRRLQLRGALLASSLLAGLLLGGLALTAAPAEAAFPGLNGRITFERDSTPNDEVQEQGFFREQEIYAIDPDGTDEANLSKNPPPCPRPPTECYTDSDPAYSPDGTKITFETRRANPAGNPAIFLMNAADGSGQTNLTRSPVTRDVSATFSPDGTKIAFSRSGDLWVMDADGKNQTPLTFDGGGPFFDHRPTWSPDGSKITFVKNFNELWVMNANGTGQMQLTTDPGTDTEPSYSPDGKKIAWRSTRGNSGFGDIFVMDADRPEDPDNNPPQRLTDRAAQEDEEADVFSDITPAFSPDGKRIAFASGRDDAGLNEDGNGEIFTMNVDGSDVEQVTRTERPSANFHDDPDWQPLLPSISIADVNVVEGNAGTTNATFTVSLSGQSGGPVSVDFATADGTATAGSDYGARRGELIFAPGETEKAITVPILGDRRDEPNETFSVNLSGAQSATIGNVRALATIVDDDAAPPPARPRPPARQCTINGTRGNDVIRGTRGGDVICAGDGNDMVHGGGGNDIVLGGSGNDVLRGDDGEDRLIGGAGNDSLYGNGGADSLHTRDARRANDVAHGGRGADSCATDPRDVCGSASAS